MSNEFDIIKNAETDIGDNIDDLITFWAVRVRATKTQWGLTDAQKGKIHKEFYKFYDGLDENTRGTFRQRIIDCGSAEKAFWAKPADTALKFMGSTVATSVGAE